MRCAAVRWFPGYLDYFCIGAAVAAVAMWALLHDEEPRWLRIVGRLSELWWALFFVTFASNIFVAELLHLSRELVVEHVGEPFEKHERQDEIFELGRISRPRIAQAASHSCGRAP